MEVSASLSPCRALNVPPPQADFLHQPASHCSAMQIPRTFPGHPQDIPAPLGDERMRAWTGVVKEDQRRTKARGQGRGRWRKGQQCMREMGKCPAPRTSLEKGGGVGTSIAITVPRLLPFLLCRQNTVYRGFDNAIPHWLSHWSLSALCSCALSNTFALFASATI